MKGDCFFEAVKKRRSIYQLGNKEILAPSDIEKLVKTALLETPSAFNSQSSRAVVLFGEAYIRLWDIVLDVLRPKVPAGKFSATEMKIESFKRGYGTILFFEDMAVVQQLQEKYPLYKDNFLIWSEQSSGMLQYVVWTGLAANGIGASLQHYNPLIDVDVIREWNLPKTWKLMSEMPFGSIEAPADEKTYFPVDSRFKVFK